MWTVFEGRKTYITAGIAFVTALMAAFGMVDVETAQEVGVLALPLAMVFLRMGVKKAEMPTG